MSSGTPTIRVMALLFFVALSLSVGTLAYGANLFAQGLNPSTKWLNLGSSLLQIAGMLQLGLVINLRRDAEPRADSSNLPTVARLRNIVHQNASIGFALLGISVAVRMYTTYF